MFESEFEQNLHRDRLQTLEKIADLGEQMGLSRPEAKYPNHFDVSTTIADLRAAYDHAPAEEFDLATAEGKPVEAAIAGRIMAIRLQGKAGFAQLQQGGERLQIYVRKDDVGEIAFALYKLLDLGDHIGVRGHLMRTRTGELTLKVSPVSLPGHEGKPVITFLAKAMLALPDKYHGLEDVELRYRQRYVDLIMNSGHSVKQHEHGPAPATPSVAQGPTATEPGAPGLALADLGEAPENNQASTPRSYPIIPSEARDPRIPPETPPQPSETTTEPRNVREVFVKRAAILRSVRKFFDERGYLEVETPMMHTVAGGAAARPFRTHHNALDIDLSLRIAPELYLKRLVVGGLDRVYEINRNFRNEGVSTQHNPEFTMLEFYQAYSNYHDLMNLTEELVTKVATEVNGTPITHFNGIQIDLSKWRKFSMREAIVKFWPERFGTPPQFQEFDSQEDFARLLDRTNRASNLRMFGAEGISGRSIDQTLHINEDNVVLSRLIYETSAGELGKSISELFEYVAEPHLIQPTIIYDFPLAVSPLSKQKPDEPDWVERFEFYIGGFEVGNAFSELNDPDEQRKRFEQQLQERDRGDDEAHAMDEDYVRALGYGLPPTAGEGIGIDRLTMLLTGSRSIRDVILFPLMRPLKKEPDEPQAIG